MNTTTQVPSWHKALPATHPEGMKSASRHAGLPQYPQLEEQIRELATAVAAGLKDESEARDDILVAVYSCDLLASTVRYWLAGRGREQAYLHDDLVFAAEEWLIRAITGRVVGQYMIDTGEQMATLMDLDRIRAGASAVGYLRKGLLMDMRKFLRTIERRSGLARRDYELVDASLISGASIAGLTPAQAATLREWDEATGGEENYLDDLRADVARSSFLDETRGTSASGRTHKRGEALRAYYEVPPATRPLDMASRKKMLDEVTKDLTYAHRALQARLNPAYATASTRRLAALWSGYTEWDAQVILDSPRAVAAAQTLALVALSPMPGVSRAVRRKFRVHLGRVFSRGGLDREAGTALADAFLADEFEMAGESMTPWTRLAEPVVSGHPDLLGSSLADVRQRLMEIVQECTQPTNRVGCL